MIDDEILANPKHYSQALIDVHLETVIKYFNHFKWDPSAETLQPIW